MNWRDRRVTVMGLGRHGGGVAAARFAAQRGAIVTVTDVAEEAELAASRAALADVPIACYALGRHEEADFRHADMVIVNPAVKPGHPLVALAREQGATLTTEVEIFLRACPARVVGVTGSNGKSTTTTMLFEMLRAAGRRAWLGGNIGRSLLPNLPAMTPEDWVAFELSSFQLARLTDESKAPPRYLDAALVTNCRPNHLDWHGDFLSYQAAKQHTLKLIQPAGVAVLNPLARELSGWPWPVDVRAASLPDEKDLPALLVPGEHNRQNARCAAAVALALGCDLVAVQAALGKFRGLPHRLQRVGEVAGRAFYNDSMATTPESVVVALAAIAEPTWLLAGGKDKGGDLRELAEAIAQRARGVCFYGAARERLRDALMTFLDSRDACDGACLARENIHLVDTLDEAVVWLFARSSPGDALLLSPACASFDQFRDYEHRASRFIAIMQNLLSREATDAR